MEEKIYRLSDDAIVYLRDIFMLGIITKTDISTHLRQMKFSQEMRGEVEYLVPTEAYKTEYAVIAEQLVMSLDKLSDESIESTESN